MKRIQLFLMLCTVLVASITQAATEKTTYFHNDALGSPIAATDGMGKLLWTESYKPFGERLEKADGNETDLFYTGKQEEKDIGLSYFGARWYDPVAGRFTGVDPVGFDAGNVHSFNRYAYANNNPYAFVDPDGNSPESVIEGLWDAGNLIGASAAYAAGYLGNDQALMEAALSGVVTHGTNLAIDAAATFSPVPGSGRAIKAGKKLTSRAARREAMRREGIPTSQQPLSQSKNSSGREYQYGVPKAGGGSQRKSVQQQTLDRSHVGQGHWEAGNVKTNPLTGKTRKNKYGRPKLTNNKSKADYD